VGDTADPCKHLSHRLQNNIIVNDVGEACLTDFGLARSLQMSGLTTKTLSGTWRFMAPEILQSPTENEDEEFLPLANLAADVWAFSMTALQVRWPLPCRSSKQISLSSSDSQIFSGEKPFQHIRFDASVILHVVLGGRPNREHFQQISNKIWTVMDSCWRGNPSQRPTMTALSQFFSQITTRNGTTPLVLASCHAILIAMI
jgi:serine/threonine protein kinase